MSPNYALNGNYEIVDKKGRVLFSGSLPLDYRLDPFQGLMHAERQVSGWACRSGKAHMARGVVLGVTVFEVKLSEKVRIREGAHVEIEDVRFDLNEWQARLRDAGKLVSDPFLPRAVS